MCLEQIDRKEVLTEDLTVLKGFYEDKDKNLWVGFGCANVQRVYYNYVNTNLNPKPEFTNCFGEGNKKYRADFHCFSADTDYSIIKNFCVLNSYRKFDLNTGQIKVKKCLIRAKTKVIFGILKTNYDYYHAIVTPSFIIVKE